LQAIQIREVQEADFEARVHGMEIAKPAGVAQEKRVTDPEQEQMIEKHLAMRQVEKRMEANSVRSHN